MTELQKLFSVIRSRNDILAEIRSNPPLFKEFSSWRKEMQDEFLDMCSGVRGHRILYDVYFKRIFSPEYSTDALKQLLEVLLGKGISSIQGLTQESAAIFHDHTLMYFDIIVKLEDGSIVNVEVFSWSPAEMSSRTTRTTSTASRSAPIQDLC